jgi:ketosteroid isomerase-like protein
MPLEETRKTIEDLSRMYMDAVNSRNVTTITQFYTKKPKFLPRSGDIPRFGPLPNNRWSEEYIGTYWQSIFQVTGGSFKYIQPMLDIEVVDDVAYEIGVYDLRMSNNEDEIEEGTYFILWQKENEQWKIAVHILNSTSHPKWGKPTFHPM